jgi:hypothetical protein
MTECNHHLQFSTTAFDRIVVLDWYDGALSGLAICQLCKQAFRFNVLASDRDERERIYAFWSLPVSILAPLDELIAALGPPRWPLWVPVWSFTTEQVQTHVEERLDQAFRDAQGPEWIVVAVRPDSCRARRNVQSGDLHVNEMMSAGATFSDWEAWITALR